MSMNPSQSQADQPRRHARPRSPVNHQSAAPIPSAAGTTTSSLRTNGASSATATAAATQRRVGVSSARVESQSASAAQPYASGSWRISDEYANAGIAATTVAVTSAAVFETSSRASA